MGQVAALKKKEHPESKDALCKVWLKWTQWIEKKIFFQPNIAQLILLWRVWKFVFQMKGLTIFQMITK